MSPGLVYEITPRCNLKCGFCYNVWPRDMGQLDTAAAIAMLSGVLEESQAAWLAYAGGEPLLYEGIETVVAAVRSRFPHVRQGVATNATMLTPRRLGRLIEAGIKYIEISLFAGDCGSYRQLTGVGAFDAVRCSIAEVRRHGVPLTVATLLSLATGQHLETVMDIAFALGANMIALNRFIPTGRGKINQGQFALTTDQLDGLLTRANRKAGGFGIPVAVTLPVEDCLLPHANYPNLQFGRCYCGESKWAIDPLGRLRTCEQNAEVLGSLLEASFSTLVSLPAVKAFRSNKASAACLDCRRFASCGGGCRFAARDA